MSTLPLPWLPGAVIAHLTADPEFMATVPAGIGSRVADPLTGPCCRVQCPANAPLDPRGWAYQALVQVSGWAPHTTIADPDGQAWQVAAHAARVLGSIGWSTWRNIGYSVRLVDGPQPHELDRSRGSSTPLHGAFVRVELRLQLT
jgi:hypothetical protein